jgi:hypothetical protein
MARVFLVHWQQQEAEERSAALRRAGHAVSVHWRTDVGPDLRTSLPDIAVISLDRVPSHGRAVAQWLWEAKKRQHIPIIFAGGEPAKVAATRAKFPRAIYCPTPEITAHVARALNAVDPPDLWVCPKCGARFVTKNLWHSCARATMQDWDARMNGHTRALFRKFCELIAACGPYHLAPAKTRIAILARVRFAGVVGVSPSDITISFALPRSLRSRRFLDVKEVAPGWWAHRIRIADTKELDGELGAWLQRSYRLMGMRERLGRTKRAAR